MFVTTVDFSEKGRNVSSLAQKDIAKFHTDLGRPAFFFIKCDVADPGWFPS